MRILLATPPMVQINTPYPATAYLTGFLESRKKEFNLTSISQKDPGLEVLLKILTSNAFDTIKETLFKIPPKKRTPSIQFFLEAFSDYRSTISDIVSFLQGNNQSLAIRIAARQFVPEGPRFISLENHETLQIAFGTLGTLDQAKHIASLYLDDIADTIRDGIDPRFEFSRYGEKLAASSPSLDPLLESLETNTLIDHTLEALVEEYFQTPPDLLCLSVPFSGTVYGAFRIAKYVRKKFPKTKIALGGGYVNTELRNLTDPRVFDFFHFITLDDGEKPLQCIIEFLQNKRPITELLRTFILEKNKVKFISSLKEHNIPFKDSATPTYKGLPIPQYISMFEMLNPMNRMWSDYRWNKITLAHGCYWRRCNFCDTTLDYISRHENDSTLRIISRMEEISKETGETGFHFTDEAAPPAVLQQLSKTLIENEKKFSWWGNIRFEKTFTPAATQLMADAGCIAVTGGLEVASDRILKLINKGVSIEQVANVTKSFSDAGIFVHAYLMYGFPTQTLQETVDSLEIVRQLFSNNCIQSAFWHRFALTVHSPIYKSPEKFGITIPEIDFEKTAPHGIFSMNDFPFHDPTPTPHDKCGEGLRKALYNYMHGIGLDEDIREWFPMKVPKTSLGPKLIKGYLNGKRT